MKKIIITILAPACFLFASCGGSKEGEESTEAENTEDTVKTEETVTQDTTSGRTEAETTETIESIEAEGEGMSFCDCAKKIQTLDDQLMAEEDDAKMEAIMAEKEKLMDGDCKVMKAGSQNTPAQRAERARKVKECLGK